MGDILTDLAALLRCPLTGQQLYLATPEEFRTLASHDADGYLVREDGAAAFPVTGGIPDLLPESMIPLIVDRS